jgi:hypothetical protein
MGSCYKKAGTLFHYLKKTATRRGEMDDFHRVPHASKVVVLK